MEKTPRKAYRRKLRDTGDQRQARRAASRAMKRGEQVNEGKKDRTQK